MPKGKKTKTGGAKRAVKRKEIGGLVCSWNPRTQIWVRRPKGKGRHPPIPCVE